MADLVRWNPFEHLAGIFREMDNLMQGTMRQFPREKHLTLSLRVDDFKLQNNPGEIIVTMEVPGATKDNIDVVVKEDRLIVSGETKKTSDNNQARILHWSKFSRSYVLPAKVNAQAATVNFKGHTLVIKMPKTKKK